MLKRFLIIILSSVLSGANAIQREVSATEAPLGKFVKEDCLFEIPKWVKRQIDCGSVTVPAFHSEPERGTFRLPVAVFRSTVNTVKQDPLIYLHGGPGDSLFPIEVFNIYGAIDLIAPERDIIMFEQRGASPAEPQFVCQEFDNYLSNYRGAIDETFVATGRELLADCLISIKDNVGIDLRAFNSLEHAKDVETIRQALGIEKWNVFGSSYGSKLAQVMLREYPETIRSVILGSVLPLAEITPLTQQDSYRAALNRSFAVCAKDVVCSEAYPNLKQVFERTVQELEVEPLLLEGATPEKSLTIDGGRFVTAIFDLYSAGLFIPSFPKIVYAAKERDESFLRGVFGVPAPDKAQYNSNSNSPDSEVTSNNRQKKTTQQAPQYNFSLRDSVLTSYMCNEEVTFIEQNEFAEEIYDYEPLREFYQSKPAYSPALYEYCQLLNINRPVASTLNEPVKSDIPALIMNGGVDPITNSENAFKVSSGLSNAQLVLFPSGTHGISIANKCATSIANAFLNAPMQALETSCADSFEIGFTTDKITKLTPFTFEAAGFSSVRPLNWVEIQIGTFARYFPSRVVLSQTFFRGSQQDALNVISNTNYNEPKQSSQPIQIDTLQANGLNWTVYKLVKDSDAITYVATTPFESKTFVVLLNLTDEANLHAYYYKKAFLPAVKKFRLMIKGE